MAHPVPGVFGAAGTYCRGRAQTTTQYLPQPHRPRTFTNSWSLAGSAMARAQLSDLAQGTGRGPWSSLNLPGHPAQADLGPAPWSYPDRQRSLSGRTTDCGLTAGVWGA